MAILAVAQVVATAQDTQTGDPVAALRDLLPSLTEGEIELLDASGELSFPYGLEPGGGVSVRLAPAFADDILGELSALDPKIGVEVLFLVDAPPALRTNGSTDPAIDARLLTTLQSIGTMEGIEYYSASRDRMRTLFHESYVIDDPDERNRVDDPVADRVYASRTIHVFQRDSSFGRNVLELTYTTDRDAVRLQMRNLTRMYYQGVIPAVGPDELRMELVVVPLGERLLFYGNSAARPLSLLGMEARVQRSFYHRLVALYRWFLDRSTAD